MSGRSGASAAQAHRQFVAGHARHLQIGDHRVGRIAVPDIQSLLPVSRDADAEPPPLKDAL